MLDHEVEGHVYRIIYRSVGSVGELHGILNRVSNVLEVVQDEALNYFLSSISMMQVERQREKRV